MSPVATPETLRVLDFPVLIEALAGRCQTPMGRERVVALTPLDDLDELRRRHGCVDECRTLLRRDGGVGLSPAQPLQAVLQRAVVAGTVLAAEDLLAAARTARVGQALRRSLAAHADLPALVAIGAAVPDLGPLVKQVATVLDDDGEVRDDASPELAALRRKKRRRRKQLLDGLETLVRGARLDGVVQDRLVTQRGGRYVVPVRAERRSGLEGVVHDSSSSGQTIYVEPLESVEQQNALVETEHAEQQEIQKLFAELTAHVRAAAGALAAAEEAIGGLDFLQGVSRFADLTDAVRPEFGDAVSIRGARHPLMIDGVLVAEPDIAADGDDAAAAPDPASGVDAPAVERQPVAGGTSKKPAIELVPLDLEIADDVGAVVITGPNTGGKTVALKTVALLSLMAQCGLPVPAARVVLRRFPRIHADIGDEQSIVANLSTFSSHLVRIKRFLADCPPGSLVLLDELGTGTDPAEGAALGIAVVERLHELGALTLVSTHHDALKAWAHGFPGATNAAMEFDGETLQPTFRLLLGLPGRSNAFDIAERLGVESSLVERARGLLDVETTQLDSLLRSVEGAAEALASDRDDVQEQQQRLAGVQSRYEAVNNELRELRERLAREGGAAVDEATATLREAGEELLAELSEELGETRKARGAQDRRARWAARVATAQRKARRHIDGAAAAVAEEAARTAAGAISEVASVFGATEDSGLLDSLEAVAGDTDPLDEPLQRGDPVIVMPLNLRGRVSREWRPGVDDEREVEVDVHGKRLIVARDQVSRLAS